MIGVKYNDRSCRKYLVRRINIGLVKGLTWEYLMDGVAMTPSEIRENFSLLKPANIDHRKFNNNNITYDI